MSIESRGFEELQRLQRRTRAWLWGCAAACLAALAILLPVAWLIAGRALSVSLAPASLSLASQRGEVVIQQIVARSQEEYAIYFFVASAEGAPVRTLDRADLELAADELGPISEYELTPASSDPLDLLIGLSTSASMGTAGRFDSARAALKGWLRTLAPWRAGLITFGGQARTEADLEADVTRVARALDRLAQAGGTALFDGVLQAAERAWGRESRQLLVALADEVDVVSRSRPSDAWSRAHGAGLPVFSVGIGDAVDRAGLEELGRKTGGRAFFASDGAAIAASLDSIAELLAAQHRVTVASVQARPGAQAARSIVLALAAAMLIAVYVVLRRWLLAPQLVVLGGPKHGLSVRLVGDILVCGSDPGCHLQVPGELKTTMGRRFALERRGSVVSFHLLDPSGATSVNRAAVESRDLVSGDIIRAGLARFLFFRLDSAGTARAGLGERVAATSERVQGTFWLSADDGGLAFKIEGDRIRVGREPDNDVVLEDPSVSRRHAEFVRTEEGFAIADLGSRNGTYLGEARVGSEAPLTDGARLRLGRLKFTVSATPPVDELTGLGEFGEMEPSGEDHSLDQTEDRPAELAAEPVAPPPVEEPSPEPPPSTVRSEAVPVSPAAAPAQPAASGVCPLCAHVNRSHARYCTQCGEKLEMVREAGR